MAISLPSAVADLIQQGLLRRDLFDALRPAQLFRALTSTRETWQANTGQSETFTRRGILPVFARSATPGTDPSPQATPSVEQWSVTCNPYNGTMDTNLANSYVEIQNNVLIDAKAIAVQAGMSINHIVRNKLYNAYLAGNTYATAASSGLIVTVAHINGFQNSTDGFGRPIAVSAANPLAITINGVAASVVAATPTDVNQPLGAGTLTLSTAMTVTSGQSVLAGNSSVIHRVGGATTSSGVASGNVLTLSDIRSGVALLRSLNVPNFDGYYRMHLDPQSEVELMADTEFRQYFQGVPDSAEYAEAMVGRAMGVDFYRDNECPQTLNVGYNDFVACDATVPSGANAGVVIHRPILYGKDVIFEKYVDLTQLLQAGFNGAAKVGDFSMAPGDVSAELDMDGIKYIIRGPQDRLQETMAQTWSYKGDWGVPTDSVTGTSALYKRAVVYEHA